MIFKSIKWRLQIWYGLILVAVLAGFGVSAYQLERGAVMRRVDEQLRRRMDAILGALHESGPRRRPGEDRRDEPPPGPPNQPGPRPRGLKDLGQIPELRQLFETNGFYYVVNSLRSGEVIRSANAPRHEMVSDGGPRPVNSPPSPKDVFPNGEPPHYRGLPRRERGDDRTFINAGEPVRRMWGDFREIEIWTPPGDIICVGYSVVGELRELHGTAVKLVLIGVAILLLGIAGGAWLVTRAIRPIGEISSAAAKISSGDLSQRINASETESELGQLAAVLNATFARLDTAFAQQKQFTSDAAHELRTPVSVILTQIQSTLNKERSGAEYRETLEACQRAAQRMRRLIESLLELARLDASQVATKREPMDLSRHAAECVELVRPLADERKITLRSELVAAPCSGDADQLALVITNLLTNAVHYNREGGEVRVTTGNENNAAVITVSDNGPGIAPEHLPHIFDRFYRADAARTSSQGRTGLGLAITKSIVEAHGGTIEVTSELGKGSSFTVRLPA